MGAVLSCIESIFRAIGSVLIAIVNGIGSIIMAIVNGVVACLDIIITFLTCGYCGRGRSGRAGGRMGGRHHHTTRTSRI